MAQTIVNPVDFIRQVKEKYEGFLGDTPKTKKLVDQLLKDLLAQGMIEPEDIEVAERRDTKAKNMYQKIKKRITPSTDVRGCGGYSPSRNC